MKKKEKGRAREHSGGGRGPGWGGEAGGQKAVWPLA